MTTSDSLSETVDRLIFGKKALKRPRAKNERVGMGDILKVRLQNTLNRQEEMKNFTVEMDVYVKIEKVKIDLEYRKLELEEKKFGYQQMRMEIEKAKVDLEYKKLDLVEKKFRHQQREDELNFMLRDTSSLDEVEKQNINLLRGQIVARMLQK